MEARLIRLALAAALLAVPAAGLAQGKVVVALLARTVEALKPAGMVATDWRQTGDLAKGEQSTWPFAILRGKVQAVVGVCDTSCTNLDLEVIDAAGKRVAVDAAPDDTPVVALPTLPATGRYRVRVRMVGCKADTCEYGLRALAK